MKKNTTPTGKLINHFMLGSTEVLVYDDFLPKTPEEKETRDERIADICMQGLRNVQMHGGDV